MAEIISIGASSLTGSNANTLIGNAFTANDFPTHVQVTNRVNRWLMFPEIVGLFLRPVGLDDSIKNVQVTSLSLLQRLASSFQAMADINQYSEMVLIEQVNDFTQEDLRMITKVLTGATLVVEMGGVILPVTVTLKSSAVGRKIELSTDGGVEYFEPEIDVISATMIVVYIPGRITHLKATGSVSDSLIMVN